MAALSSAAPPALDASLAQASEALSGASAENFAGLSAALSDAVKAAGIPSLHAIMPHLINFMESGSPSAKQGSLQAVVALCEMGQPAEPYLVKAMPTILNLGSAKDAEVRNQAEAAAHALMARCSAGTCFVMPSIFAAMDKAKPWQTRILAMSLISDGVRDAPEQVKQCLADMIPQLTPCMTDTKKQVNKEAKTAISGALTVVGNKDIEEFLPAVVRCISKPAEVPELMHKLAAVVFVQTMETAAMAALVPMLVRGLREKSTATKRQTSVIIDNMSKLVDNPVDAAPFIPLLLPALEKAADTVSDPEARSMCDRALKQLQRLDNESKKVGDLSRTSPATVLEILKTAVATEVDDVFETSLNYLSVVGASMIDARVRDAAQWATIVSPYLTSFLASDKIAAACAAIHAEAIKHIKEVPEEEEEDDDKEMLADCEFTLAYGTKILLHNTKLKLKRGNRYGLLGPNDCGKTTLMRSIASEQIDGFPPATELRSVFVEADILGELSHLTCTDYVLADPRIQGDGITREQVREMLSSVHFNDKMLDDGVDTLSGGWRMKLALARAMLLKADILLLDEPTNHLDVMNVKWVKDYLISLSNVTSIIVSHDAGLLDDVCTHIIQIENLKLHMHKGNLSVFVQKVPEARSYFELSASKMKFKFPQPGPLEGVKSKGKAIMKMNDVCYTYPGNKAHTIIGCTVQVSLSSRVGCVGPNGAGKSTMIKCLTGEVEPTTGTRWAHPNLRMAYVAQHAFHHIEKHLDKTPNEYLRWRYASGEDREALNKVTMVVTEEEQALMDTPFEFQWKDESDKIHKQKRVCEKLTGMRREKNKEFEYECKWKGLDMEANSWVSKTKLLKMGWDKHMKAIDQKIATMAGMYIRPLTTSNVEQHLEDVGLSREFGTHYRMRALSGGQKVKVVIGAAMWNQPHVVILDEPTNYLDRESLGALANAIIEYEGGVVIITHNDEFCRTICPERWVLQKMGDGIGRLDCQGDPEWMQHALDQKVDYSAAAEPDEVVDAAGNVTKIQKVVKLSKKEIKQKVKKLKAKIKAGDPLDSDEEEFCEEHGVAYN